MNKAAKNKEKAKAFGPDILSKIENMIAEHNQEVERMNREKKPIKVVVEKGDPKADEEFYMFATDTA